MTSAVPFAGGAGEVGEHGRRLAEAHVERQAAAELGGVEEAEPGQRLGLVGAQLADEALRAGDRRGRRLAGASRRCRWPSCCRGRTTPPARPDPSSPMLVAQDLGAGELGDRGSRSASAAAAFSRSTRSTSTHLPRDCTSGRAWRAKLGDLGGGQLDVVEQHRPGDVAELVGADDRARCASANRRSDGVALRRESAGTRTSKPAGRASGRRRS